LVKREGRNGQEVYHIDKRIRGFGRLCESTGTSDETEAGRYLHHRLEQIRHMQVYGERPRRTFREAAAHYLTVNAGKRRLLRDAQCLKDLDPFIGEAYLEAIHEDSFEGYRRARAHLTPQTRNRVIGVARRILTHAARLWTYPRTSLTWLEREPIILMEKEEAVRAPYPLNDEELELLLAELVPATARMARFAVHTGLRDQELCRLEWGFEHRLPELEVLGVPRSVFVLPGWVTKSGRPRVAVLNDVAQGLLEEVRGEHARFVFTHCHRQAERTPYARLNGSGWQSARRRAAAAFEVAHGRMAPEGFRCIRVHDLRHTFGRRLRAAGVSHEDRRDLLGHKSGSVTTDYSAAELSTLLYAVNQLIHSRKIPTTTVLRIIGR
jgi:integrase